MVSGVVSVIRGGYQIRDERSDTIFIFVNLNKADSDHFQRSVGRRITVNLMVDSGEESASIHAHISH